MTREDVVGRVVIRNVSEARSVAFPAINGISGQGPVTTTAVIGDDERPIHLWKHDMQPGAEVRFTKPAFDHLFYVLDGKVDIDGQTADAGSAIGAEHRCSGIMRAKSGTASLLHFHRPDDHPEHPTRAGGHVHVIGKEGILRSDRPEYGVKGVLWADSDCPTCHMWLHGTDLATPRGQKGSLHYHTSDEIIFILSGEMVIGRRRLKPGTALAIDADTRYGFGVGEPGLSFVNFRPRDSFVVLVESGDGKPQNELDSWRRGAVSASAGA
jgi:quercetin dioxygenase-like cupin family protein